MEGEKGKTGEVGMRRRRRRSAGEVRGSREMSAGEERKGGREGGRDQTVCFYVFCKAERWRDWLRVGGGGGVTLRSETDKMAPREQRENAASGHCHLISHSCQLTHTHTTHTDWRRRHLQNVCAAREKLVDEEWVYCLKLILKSQEHVARQEVPEHIVACVIELPTDCPDWQNLLIRHQTEEVGPSSWNPPLVMSLRALVSHWSFYDQILVCFLNNSSEIVRVDI